MFDQLPIELWSIVVTFLSPVEINKINNYLSYPDSKLYLSWLFYNFPVIHQLYLKYGSTKSPETNIHTLCFELDAFPIGYSSSNYVKRKNQLLVLNWKRDLKCRSVSIRIGWYLHIRVWNRYFRRVWNRYCRPI